MGDPRKLLLDATVTAGQALLDRLDEVMKERDEAREEVERLRARVAELEAVATAAARLWKESSESGRVLHDSYEVDQLAGALNALEGFDWDGSPDDRIEELEQQVSDLEDERDAAQARVAELEARPTVHPLAWAYLQMIAKTGCYLLNKTSGSLGPLDKLKGRWEDWWTERCPLTATGGEVLVPGEEP